MSASVSDESPGATDQCEELDGEPIVEYQCLLGTTHRIPGPDIRVLKTGDAGFEVACDCTDEPLEESHERPHKSTEHFSYADGREIPAMGWLALEELADAWYDVEPWMPPDGFSGTRKQRRQQVRETMEERAEGMSGNRVFSSQSEQRRHENAREVTCPNCDASSGSKCVRPAGHRVRNCHAARLTKAEAEGIIESSSGNDGESTTEDEQSQRVISDWTQ